MAATVHNGLWPDLMRTPAHLTSSLFTPDFAFDESHNVFESSFKEGAAAIDRAGEVAGPSRSSPKPPPCSEAFLRSITDAALSPFFSLPANIGSTMLPADSNGPAQRLGQGHQSTTVSSDQFGLGSAVWNVSPPDTQLDVLSPLDLESETYSPTHASDPSALWPRSSPEHLVIDTKLPRIWPKYGQITPPSDSPVRPAELAVPSSASAARGQLLPEAPPQQDRATPTPVDGPTKRKRGRRPSQPASATDANPAKRRRKSTGRAKSVVQEEPSDQAGDDDRRNRFLERNRVAASKCRQKKKEWTNNLESRARKLQNENTQLMLMLSSLKDEVLFLKGEMLKHTNCECERIRQYLDNEADKIAPGPRAPQGLHVSSRRSATGTPRPSSVGLTESKASTVIDDSVASSPVDATMKPTARGLPASEEAQAHTRSPLEGELFTALTAEVPS